jgi:dTDP-4-dehydrorhamnose reductase
MQILITGASGTVGQALIQSIHQRGFSYIPMGRNDLDITNEIELDAFLESKKIDAIMHLAKADVTYTERLIRFAKKKHIPFLFTSSYKVFSGKSVSAPYSEYDRPDATDDFANQKLTLERLVLDLYPEGGFVVRLAWQIGHQPGGFQMLSFIKDQMDKKGVFQVSKHLYLSTMFIEDTCEGLLDIIEKHAPGLYHLEGNDGYSFYDIAYYLKTARNQDWIILDDSKKFSKNDVMDNTKVKVKTLSQYGIIHHPE